MGYARELFRTAADSNGISVGPKQFRSGLMGTRSRWGSVPVNAARAVVRSAARFGDSAFDAVSQPGPEIRVRPFDPGSTSVGAMAAKSLLAYMGGIRAKANFDAEQRRLSDKAARENAIASSTIAANMARAAASDRSNTGAMTPYQERTLGLRERALRLAEERGRGGSGRPPTALLGYGLAGIRAQEGAASAFTPEDDAKIEGLRRAALSYAPGASVTQAQRGVMHPAVQELGITPAEITWANRSEDRVGAWTGIVNEAAKRYRERLLATKGGRAKTSGAAAARALLSRYGVDLPEDEQAQGDGMDWTEVPRRWDEEDAGDQ